MTMFVWTYKGNKMQTLSENFELHKHFALTVS